MYLIAFLKNLIKKNNITASIYFLFNMFLVFLIFGGILLFTEDGAKGWQMGFIGLVIYFIGLCIALSPIGEWILRFQNNCKPIDKSAYTSKLLPLFYDVYNRARQISPSINNNISLFYSLDESANAFAIGRKTIVVTRGLMQLPDESIKAILAHEFGHIAHNDTDIVLAITVGNFIITSVYMFFLVIINISILIANLFSSNKIGCIIQAVFNALLGGVFWLWMKFGQIMVMNSSRANEFSADEFSANCGFSTNLCQALDMIANYGNPKIGLFSFLQSSHPSTPIRIKRLIDLGATYYQY